MSTTTAKLAISLLFLFCGVSAAAQGTQKSFPDEYQEKWEKSGPNVRYMRHYDGSKTEFRRSPDDRIHTKKTYNTNGRLVLTSVYRMDANGNPRSCKIYGKDRQVLYKVSYGYHKVHGRLVAEDMFDARRQHINPKTGKELPVRRMYYTYDTSGNRSRPIAYVFVKGKTSEEIFGPDNKRPTYLPEDNPFRNEGRR